MMLYSGCAHDKSDRLEFGIQISDLCSKGFQVLLRMYIKMKRRDCALKVCKRLIFICKDV